LPHARSLHHHHRLHHHHHPLLLLAPLLPTLLVPLPKVLVLVLVLVARQVSSTAWCSLSVLHHAA
jgi:hypothetical protein